MASVGFDLPSDDVTNLHFYSDSSLLDFDLIIFSPILDAQDYSSETYLGKYSFDEDQSFRLRDAIEHWKRELDDAVNHGKTVFIFLCAIETVYAATGEKTYSGTGKNRQATTLVEPISNYECLPFDIEPTGASGEKMSVVPDFKELFEQYWALAEDYSSFRVISESPLGTTCIKTETGEKSVGRAFGQSGSDGVAFILPYLDMDDYGLAEEDDYGRLIWTDEGKKLGKRIGQQLIWIHKNARQKSTKTPAPDWAADQSFLLKKEMILNEAIKQISDEISSLVEKRDKLEADLLGQSKLRDLLFENGRALEEAIHLALGHLGFSTSNYNENGSEFDVVFEAPEGRLLGEAEGKDNKAINVGKLRQLQMNILEDLERDEIEHPAKGVLFGNSFRLTAPNGRTEQFTTKCIAAAKQNGTALMSTLELFKAAKYLAENEDSVFAKTAERFCWRRLAS